MSFCLFGFISAWESGLGIWPGNLVGMPRRLPAESYCIDVLTAL
jgi:hypothetical protein